MSHQQNAVAVPVSSAKGYKAKVREKRQQEAVAAEANPEMDPMDRALRFLADVTSAVEAQNVSEVGYLIGAGIGLAKELRQAKEWPAVDVIQGALDAANDFRLPKAMEALDEVLCSGHGSVQENGDDLAKIRKMQGCIREARAILTDLGQRYFLDAMDRYFGSQKETDSFLRNQEDSVGWLEEQARNLVNKSKTIHQVTWALGSRITANLQYGKINVGAAYVALEELERLIGVRQDLRKRIEDTEQSLPKHKRRK